MKIPIYLVENYIAEGVPPELLYSLERGVNGKLIGYVLTENEAEKEYQGTWGYYIKNKDWMVQGFYSTHSLIRCAKAKSYELTWEDHVEN
jgi:hypothetical protein